MAVVQLGQAERVDHPHRAVSGHVVAERYRGIAQETVLVDFDAARVRTDRRCKQRQQHAKDGNEQG